MLSRNAKLLLVTRDVFVCVRVFVDDVDELESPWRRAAGHLSQNTPILTIFLLPSVALDGSVSARVRLRYRLMCPTTSNARLVHHKLWLC